MELSGLRRPLLISSQPRRKLLATASDSSPSPCWGWGWGGSILTVPWAIPQGNSGISIYLSSKQELPAQGYPLCFLSLPRAAESHPPYYPLLFWVVPQEHLPDTQRSCNIWCSTDFWAEETGCCSDSEAKVREAPY